MTFTEFLTTIRDSFRLPPEAINNGYCADFATVAWEQWRPTGQVRVIADSDLDHGREYTHTFLRYGGMYFDAEAVEGVCDWRELPIYERQAREAIAASVPAG